jgi:N-acylneuraminate cytidylyltransferase
MVAGQSGKVVAVIPARGGSKRIKGKNIIDFFGKPMISYTILEALKASIIDYVLVSTDDPEIAAISKDYGANVPFLRETSYDDYSPVSEATLGAIDQLQAEEGLVFDTVIQLMANCPLRLSTSIEKQLQFFEQDINRTSVISGMKYGMFNPHWAHAVKSDGTASKIFADTVNQRSQDLPELLCPTGATWISSCKQLSKHGSFYSPGYRFFEVDTFEGVDIDDYDDLAFAKCAKTLRDQL